MAAVIHALWSQDDRSPMILPASVPIHLGGVQSELTRYMDETWDAVIASDVDGENSLPLRLDSELSNLGRYSATRRVARTVYMGSAPTYKMQNPGIDDRQIKLGAVQPGEAPATFGDALRRLANGATAGDLRESLERRYSDEPFVGVVPDGVAPATRHVRGSNHCLIGVFADRIKGRAIIVSVLDNLVKGAAGQAVQNMNLVCQLSEATGLEQVPLFP